MLASPSDSEGPRKISPLIRFGSQSGGKWAAMRSFPKLIKPWLLNWFLASFFRPIFATPKFLIRFSKKAHVHAKKNYFKKFPYQKPWATVIFSFCDKMLGKTAKACWTSMKILLTSKETIARKGRKKYAFPRLNFVTFPTQKVKQKYLLVNRTAINPGYSNE